MSEVYQREGSPFWYFTVTENGKRVRKSTKTKIKKEAQLVMAKHLAGIRQEQEAKQDPASYGPSLHEAYTRALREYKPWRDSPDMRTIEKNQRALYEHFGQTRKLATIDQVAIAEYMQKLASEGKAGSTINQRVSPLLVLYSEAIDHWGFDKLVKPRIVRHKVYEGRQRRFTGEEVQEAIRRLEKGPLEVYKDVADLIRVLSDTGMRLNEALSLTRAGFDLEERQIILWVTKNKQPRAVPMTPLVHQVLTKRAHLSKPFGMVSTTQASRAWRWVRAEMGFAEDKEFVMHTLRHTVGSRLADANVSAPLIQHMLGHKNMKTTQKYIHVSAAGLRGVADILAKDCALSVPEWDSKEASNEPDGTEIKAVSS
jgi:integrase